MALAFATAVMLWLQKDSIRIPNIVPLVCFASLIGLQNIRGIQTFGSYTMFLHLLLAATYLLHFTIQRNFTLLARCFLFFSFVEGVLCIGQYLDWITTKGKLFEVYGSLPNPNYTAMFLSMAFPAILFSIYSEKNRWRIFAIISLLLLITALFLLQCRTALIGVSVCSLVFVSQKVLNIIIQKVKYYLASSKWRMLLASVVFVGITCSALFTLYAYKQRSSEGRLFIWKIGLDLGLQKPVLGHGVYTFEKVYNLAQAAYFRSGIATEDEIYTASHIRTPYNDYLLLFIESGIVGVVLFLTMIGTLCYYYHKSPKELIHKTAFAGVLSFAIMALSNSVLYITAIASVFVLYFSILCANTVGKSFVIPRKYLKLSAALLAFLAFLVMSQYLAMAKASLGLKVANERFKQNKKDQALAILEQSSKTIPFSDQVWISSGDFLKIDKKYSIAIPKYEQAIQLTSDPDVLLDLGFCYTQTKQFDYAIDRCSLAMNIVPNRIKPRFALMNVFLAKQDTTTALILAKEIIAQKPKGISKDAANYKERASYLLQKFSQR